MKITAFLCFLGIGTFFGGCAISETDADGVGQQFQEGIQGRGQIVPNNPTSGSFGPEYR